MKLKSVLLLIVIIEADLHITLVVDDSEPLGIDSQQHRLVFTGLQSLQE
jgi:hypothetical protein